MIGIDAADLLLTTGMAGIAIIGYFIRDSISSFRKSIDKLDKTIEKLGTDINEHDGRLRYIEYKLKVKE